ncbi:MAG: antibiotic biosynthesis monooxygenase [Proteobacteria bacterium]|nr:antibiotic biosynthesis monooxygenase [Pseudomonadota bacterium]
MPFNSITRLRLRSLFTLPAFARETRAIAAQAAAAEGFLGGAVLAEGWMVFWTRTVWESEAAMKAFRDSDAHRASMPKLLDWCSEAMVAHWQGEPESDWSNIHERMTREGRKSNVRRPSRAHEQRSLAPMRRWSPEQPIAAAK